jgi:hypothetical protein
MTTKRNSMLKYAAALGKRAHVGVAAALIAAAVAGAWTTSPLFEAKAAPVEELARFAVLQNGDAKKVLEEAKPVLVGSYAVTGTDPDGKAYAGGGIVDIALAPSGALELEWDNGKYLGVGQVIGNTLAVACSIKGRTVILIMNVNPDGTLSGKWLRRADRGSKGTETWKRI